MEEEDWVRERMRAGVVTRSGLVELLEETCERVCGGVVVPTMLRELEEWVRGGVVWCPDIYLSVGFGGGFGEYGNKGGVREEAVNVKEGSCTLRVPGSHFAGGGCGLESS
jgi:hypothetical protein